jgi:hypothetical protein
MSDDDHQWAIDAGRKLPGVLDRYDFVGRFEARRSAQA